MLVPNAVDFQFDSVLNSSSVLASCMMFRTYDLTGDDASVLLTAFSIFMECEHIYPIPYKSSRVVCMIVSDRDQIVMQAEPHVLGQTAECIFLFMHRSLQLKQPSRRVAVVLEELLHRYYLIHDEWAVKERLMPLLQSRFPDVTLHSLYPKMFDACGRRILRDQSAPQTSSADKA